MVYFDSAVSIAEGVRAGELDPVDVVGSFVERIEEREDVTNAYVTVTAEEARRSAREVRQRVEEGDDLPLAGVPIGVKDLSETKKGVRNTMGLKPFEDNVAEETSVTVRRLEEAGAVVVGTTNTPELGHTVRTDNLLQGPTATPFDTERNAGGSSGGSAAALADGLCALATGSDVGGSLRNPASCCGVVSVKPSHGTVPRGNAVNGFRGHTPVGVLGPMARDVESLALALDVVAGKDAIDPFSVPGRTMSSFHAAVSEAPDVSDLRLAYSSDLDLFAVEESVRDAVEDTLSALEDDGATVEVQELEGALTECGTVTEPGGYELEDDLSSDSTCIEITGDDVTLDGMGANITADGAGDDQHGVLVDGAQNVTVKNVTVEGWDGETGAGVAVRDSSNVEVSEAVVRSNFFGVSLVETDDSVVTRTNASANDAIGVSLEGSSENVVTDNTLLGQEGGVALDNSTDNEVVGNTAEENEVRGIGLGDGSDENLVEDNVLSGNDGEGILVQSSSDNQVLNNTAESNRVGIELEGFSDGNRVEGNTLADNDEAGLSLSVSSDNQVIDNTATGNEFGVILVSESDNNTLTDNTAEENDEGIVLIASRENEIKGNVANGNSVGLALSDASMDNLIIDTAAQDNAGNAVEVRDAISTGNDFADIDLGDSTAPNTTVSFEAEAANVDAVSSPADPPTGQEGIGRYFEAESNDENAFLDIEVSYTDADIDEIDEDSLSLWRLDAGEWVEVESEVDTEENVVTANVDGFTTFGVFGELAEPVENVDAGTSHDTVQEAVDNANEGDEIEIAAGIYEESVIISTDGITLRPASGDSVSLLAVTEAAEVDADDVTVEEVGLFGSPDAAVRDVTGVELNGVPLENETVTVENARNVSLDSTALETEPSGVEVEEDFGSYVEITETGEEPAVDIEIEPDSGIDDPTDVGLWKFDGSSWSEVDGSEVEDGTVTASPSEGDFSTFAIFRTSETTETEPSGPSGGGGGFGGGLGGGGVSEARFSFDVQAATAEVDVGETVEFVGTVEMTSGVVSDTEVVMTANGRVIETKQLGLLRGETVDVAFSHTFDEEGIYDIQIDGEYIGNVRVGDPEVDETPEEFDELRDENEELRERVDRLESMIEDEDEQQVAEEEGEEDTTPDREAEMAWDEGEGMPGFTVLLALLSLAFVLYLRKSDN